MSEDLANRLCEAEVKTREAEQSLTLLQRLPRFIDMQVGWLERQTESFHILVVNRYIGVLEKGFEINIHK